MARDVQVAHDSLHREAKIPLGSVSFLMDYTILCGILYLKFKTLYDNGILILIIYYREGLIF